MLKIDRYHLVKTVFYLVQVFIAFVIIHQGEYTLSTFYIPFIFLVITATLTYIINTQTDNKASKMLIYFLLAGSIAYTSSYGNVLGLNITVIVFAISFQLCGFFFRLFVHEVLFKRRLIYNNQYKSDIFSYISLVFVIVLYIYHTFTNVFDIMPFILFLIYFLLNISIPLVRIVLLLIEKKPKDKLFLTWMLAIPVVALAPFFLFHVIPLIFNYPWIVNAYVTSWMFFIIPLGYTYLILTNRLLNIKFVLNRSMYYGGLALIPSLLMVLALYLFHPQFTLLDSIQNFIVLTILNTMFLFLKEKLDYKFRAFLFKDHNNIIQFIEDIMKRMRNCITRKDLRNVISQEISKYFSSVEATIIIYNTVTEDTERDYLIGKSDFDDVPFVNLCDKENDIIFEFQDSLGACISSRSESEHYLFLKKDKKHVFFNAADKTRFLIIISILQFAYENIRMNEESVTRLIDGGEETSTAASRFLFHFAETERRRLAEDIHDTILQDQIHIFRELDFMINDQNDSKLLSLREDIKQVIDKTRLTCEEMMPNSLTRKGLTFSLNELLQQLQQKTSFQLNYDIEVISEKFNHYEKPIMIYRIVEEMINNAIKHSEAERVSIDIWETEETINIDYLDDGKGFDHQEALHKEHIGLSSIVRRVMNMKGNIDFHTNNPQKVQIFITIPR